MYYPRSHDEPTDYMMMRLKFLRMMDKIDQLEKQELAAAQKQTSYYQPSPPAPVQYPPSYYQQPSPVPLEYPASYYQPPASVQYPTDYHQQETPANWRKFMSENNIRPRNNLDPKENAEEIPEI